MLPRGGRRVTRQSQRYVAVLSAPLRALPRLPHPPRMKKYIFLIICMLAPVFFFFFKSFSRHFSLVLFLAPSLFIFLVTHFLPSITAPAYPGLPCTPSRSSENIVVEIPFISLYCASSPSCRRRSVVLPSRCPKRTSSISNFLSLSPSYICWICCFYMNL